jgi:hypothetical protein
MRRAIELLLMLAIAAGAYFAWRTGRERARLQTEYGRIVRAVGDLAVGDPSRVHVAAIATGEPLHFAWRVHVPAGVALDARGLSGGGSTSWGGSSSSSVNAQDLIARVRLREEGGRMQVYSQFAGGSSLASAADPELTAFLRGKAGRLRVEQVGQGGVVALEPKRPATLLRLTLPDDLLTEARRALPPEVAGRLAPTLYELVLTPR